MNVSKCSLGWILQEDLHPGAYSRCVSHLLDARLKKYLHYEKCKKLLKRFQKMHTTESYLLMKDFPYRGKITVHMAKVV